jgi:FKBP-type peptidyl-prolyl cis-trans isomerase 2
MKLNKSLLVSLLLAASLAISCAVEPDEDKDIAYDRMMTSWIRVNYPSAKPFGTYGAYVLEMEKGDGASIGDSAYVRAFYTKRALDGTIMDTDVEEIAMQLGSYDASYNYAGNTWRMTQGYVPDALEEVLRTMRDGGSTLIALPKSSSYHKTSMYDAFSSTEESNNYIYAIEIDTVVTDIIGYQDKEMRKWFRARYDSEDTISQHQFFKKLEEKTADTDTIKEGSSINVYYVGRLMDGQVFDTNIEDTAKFYRIWSGAKDYKALSLTFRKSEEESSDSSNGVVKGFEQAILKMNYGEKAVTLFNSELGYGEAGSNPAIPEYSPLVFWLYIDPSKD